MRRITKVSTLVAVVGISLAAGLAPASADTVTSPISGGSLGVTATSPALSAVTLNGTNTQTSTGTASPWTITDARGTGAAWTVSVAAGTFTSAAGTSDTVARTLTGNPLTITPGTVTAGDGADPTTNITATSRNVTGTAQALISASGTSKGSYNVSPAYSVAIPANSYRSNYTTGTSGALNPYTSTITFTIG